jgi:predicted molibdopterin-dependent oxidoreductase YjgC
LLERVIRVIEQKALGNFKFSEGVMCVDLIKLTIDGKEVEVPAGTSVLDAAESIGIHIPRLCYDPCLSSVGACRGEYKVCAVKVERLAS